jgi:hypothetical protein
MALSHIKDCANNAQVAINIHISRRSVNDWVKRFYENGGRLKAETLASYIAQEFKVDYVAWHQLHLADKFDNLSIIKLPPYSPELNAIEQVWQWLRQNKLANRVLEAMKILLMNAVELGVFSYLMPLE